MKKYCFYNENIPFEADNAKLQQIKAEKKQLLDNYLEISSDLEDEMYISRGNGFCTTKWAPDVIEDKIEELTKQLKQIEEWLEE